MNARQRMAERILNHGFDIKQIFFADPYSQEISPLQVAKALHRIETRMHRIAEQYCNGDIEQDVVDKAEVSAMKAIKRLLPNPNKVPVIINLDPRGYALKIPDEYVRANNIKIHRDWGGYGILAPEFDGRP